MSLNNFGSEWTRYELHFFFTCKHTKAIHTTKLGKGQITKRKETFHCKLILGTSDTFSPQNQTQNANENDHDHYVLFLPLTQLTYLISLSKDHSPYLLDLPILILLNFASPSLCGQNHKGISENSSSRRGTFALQWRPTVVHGGVLDLTAALKRKGMILHKNIIWEKNISNFSLHFKNNDRKS